MVAAISADNILLGAGSPYYRDVGVLTAWTGVGATMDDTTWRINQSWMRPDLNGMLGPVSRMDYLTEQQAEMEFTMVEVAGTKLAIAIPGATSVTTATTAAGGGATGTLAADAAIGATSITLNSATGWAVGDWMKIGASAFEYRQITGLTGVVASFRDPLKTARTSGQAVVEVVGDGKTEITGSTVRRMPATAYKQWAMTFEAPSDYYELVLDSGISATDTAEITVGDETVGGIRTTIAARYAEATPNTPPWRLRVP